MRVVSINAIQEISPIPHPSSGSLLNQDSCQPERPQVLHLAYNTYQKLLLFVHWRSQGHRGQLQNILTRNTMKKFL